MSIFSSYLNTLTKRYATFSGRANRQEYCAFMIVFSTYVLIGQVLHSLLIYKLIDKHIDKVLFCIRLMTLIHLIPLSLLVKRRLNDVGISRGSYLQYDLNNSGWRFIVVSLVFFLIAAGIHICIYIGLGMDIPIEGYVCMMMLVVLGAMAGEPKENIWGKAPAKKDNVANRPWVLAIMVNIICFVALLHLLREMHDGTA